MLHVMLDRHVARVNTPNTTRAQSFLVRINLLLMSRARRMTTTAVIVIYQSVFYCDIDVHVVLRDLTVKNILKK